MNEFDSTTKVGDLVTERPSRARVFEEHGIDYCCGGGRPLEEACAERDVSLDEIRAALEKSDRRESSTDETDWSRQTATALIDHIVATHHEYLRSEFPFLDETVRKVVKAHGDRHPETLDLLEVFTALREELTLHMMKEERILFPAIRAWDAGGAAGEVSVEALLPPIHMMEQEHASAGEALRRMRELTGDFTAPDDACRTWLVMLDRLEALERDLHIHIHKENNILFPRVLRETDGDDDASRR